ncbi:glycoside hydrolase family 38 C-terminal domain-containing protein [Devosia sp. ZB163]|uniref:alpha-mannosidase n=1 Tax=Devosia sp. ZB163 TaxID=3025938 RepID=UPI002361630C|nr:glycoside hydrolase family 38 C-terminal domain-containing protein [Devosia sp. ZB163]MDC9825438.1 glycoside hydrolase family 38 C-terminal domain-containing protein [Devosia sp. ZB163]
MALSIGQRLDRVKARLGELLFWRERETVPVGGWLCNGAPIEIGAPWPSRDGVQGFAAAATVPAHWPLSETRIFLDLGGEALATLVYADEKVAFGNDPYHKRFPVKARDFRIEAEAVARLPFGEPVRSPVLTGARLYWLDTAVDSLRVRLHLILETCDELEDHEVTPHLIAAAEEAFHALDWPSGSQDYVARFAPQSGQQKIWQLPPLKDNPAGLDDEQRASVVAADRQLVARLRELQKRFPQQGQIALTGHAHIDLAWLWPYSETRRKMRRTFSTAVSLMEGSNEYLAQSGFRFNQSTAHYYAQIEEDDPALFARIKAKVAAGSWETVGGMWVEPDTNMPTGESLTRQILYGQRYFQQKFGVRHTVCWLPDCFGFSGGLPQLLRQGGIDSFFTIKVNWNDTNTIPADLFWWEGIDGSRVLTHTFDNPWQGYNGAVNALSINKTWKNFKQKAAHPTSLLAVGYGDGGGGVTPEYVVREMMLRDFPALPKARWSRVEDFFAAAHLTGQQTQLPVWQGDIYLELHRATLTTQSATKKAHRQAERALITAETLASLATLLGGEQPESLEHIWRVVLKNEFHDILPGSSIAEVYEDAERELNDAYGRAVARQQIAMSSIVGHIPDGDVDDAVVVVNPSLSRRPLRVTTSDGTHFSTADVVPPLSVKVFTRATLEPLEGLSVSETHLENAHIRAEIGADGTVTSLVHKATGREALDGRGNQLWVYPGDKPRDWDAWDIEEDYDRSGIELDAPESIKVTEHSNTRAAVRVVRRFRASRVIQTYVLEANGTRLDIVTEIDWHDRHCLLRTITPVSVRTTHATFEHANGVVRRTTHDNTSWDQAQFEVPGHRFIDMSEPGFGVALLNDAKYGHSAKGNVLGLSLVRSPVYPDPLADEGGQRFTYALYPHAGDWHEGRVREEAEDLNQPMLAAVASGVAAVTLTPIGTEGIPAALSGLKAAEDGDGLILRVYEPSGRRGEFAVTAPSGWEVSGSLNILEEPMDRGEGAALRPFEVRSWRISKG